MTRFILCAAIVSSTLACFRDSGDESMSADTIVSQLGLSIPPGTRILGASKSNEREGLVRAKLEIPATQVASFMASANIQALEEAGPDLLGPDKDFWDPHQAGPLRSGDAALPGARFLLVAVEERNTEKAIVYLMVHGT
jgi:hypothetical protein